MSSWSRSGVLWLKFAAVLGASWLILTLALPVLGDVAPPEQAPSSSIGPAGVTQVRMLAERVLLDIRASEPNQDNRSLADDQALAQVSATFLMRNLGQADQTIQVRFPLKAPTDFSDVASMEGFTVKVNGQTAATKTISNRLGANGPEIQWAAFDVTFPIDIVHQLAPADLTPLAQSAPLALGAVSKGAPAHLQEKRADKATLVHVYPSPAVAQDGVAFAQLLLAGSPFMSEVYRSNDGSRSWEAFLMLAGGVMGLSLSPDFATDRTLVSTSLRSPDGGETWTQWSPGLAFVSDRAGNREIYMSDEGGQWVEQLTGDPAADENPAWTRLAFRSDRSGNTAIPTPEPTPTPALITIPTLTPVGHLGGRMKATCVHNGYAYLDLGPELVILDVSQPAQLARVGAILLPDEVNDVEVAGRLAYVLADGLRWAAYL